MALEHDPLAPAFMCLVQHCVASHRGSRDRRIDSRSARIFWSGQQDGAAGKIDLLATIAETKNRVGSEAGQCLIAKGELGARIAPGADSGAFHYAVINGRRTRSALRSEQPHVADYLSNTGLLFYRCADESRNAHREEEDEQIAKQVFHGVILRPLLWMLLPLKRKYLCRSYGRCLARFAARLKLYRQRKGAARIGDLIVEEMFIGLIGGPGAQCAGGEISREPITRDQGTNSAHIHTRLLMEIIAHHDTGGGVQAECPSKICRVRNIGLVIVAPWPFRFRSKTDFHICPKSELLGATERHRFFGVEDDGVVREKLVPSLVGREPVIIVLQAQKEIVQLRDGATEANIDIEAVEIEVVEAVV